MHTLIHACTQTYTCILAYKRACIHTYIHTYTHTHTHTAYNFFISDLDFFQVRSFDFTTFRSELSDLSNAINGTLDTPERTNALATVNNVIAETRALEAAFVQVEDKADITDFSSTLDTIDFIELSR